MPDRFWARAGNPMHRARRIGYRTASAVASSGEIVAYFATPTMVNTLLKWGVRPKMPIERWPALLASSSIWMMMAMPEELTYSTPVKSSRTFVTGAPRPWYASMMASLEVDAMSPAKARMVTELPEAAVAARSVTLVAACIIFSPCRDG